MRFSGFGAVGAAFRDTLSLAVRDTVSAATRLQGFSCSHSSGRSSDGDSNGI